MIFLPLLVKLGEIVDDVAEPEGPREEIEWRVVSRRDAVIYSTAIALLLALVSIVAPVNEGIKELPVAASKQVVEVGVMPVVSVPNVPTVINDETNPSAAQLAGQVFAALQEVRPRPKPETYTPMEFVVIEPGGVYTTGCGQEEILLATAVVCHESPATRFIVWYRPEFDPAKVGFVALCVQAYLQNLGYVRHELATAYRETLELLLAEDRLRLGFYDKLTRVAV